MEFILYERLFQTDNVNTILRPNIVRNRYAVVEFVLV